MGEDDFGIRLEYAERAPKGNPKDASPHRSVGRCLKRPHASVSVSAISHKSRAMDAFAFNSPGNVLKGFAGDYEFTGCKQSTRGQATLRRSNTRCRLPRR